MTIKLTAATQTAMFTALSGLAIAPDWPVYVDVPAEAEPPYMLIGDIEVEPGESKGSKNVIIDVIYVYRGEDRLQLLDRMDAVEEGIGAVELIESGVSFETPEWLSSSVSAPQDGVTHVGLQQYRIGAEPA